MFLKRCKKYFTPSGLRTIYVTYIRQKMKYNSHLWVGASKSALDFVDRIQSRALKLINDRVASCIVLFYKYNFGKCSSELSELIPQPRYSRGIPGSPDAAMLTLLRSCPTAQRITGKILSLPELHDCGTTYLQISFQLAISLFKARINQQFLLFPPSI